MGTDIYIQVQQQTDEGVWIDYHENPWAAADAAITAWTKAWLENRTYDGPPRNHPLDRDYALWGWMFGVRKADGVGVFPLRGLPEGMTADSREREFAERGPSGSGPGGSGWLGDHSFTYATLEELRALPWGTAPDGDLRTWLFGPELEFAAIEAGGLTRVRLLFGFDN